MFKAIIIDDEKNGREILNLLISNFCEDLTIVDSVSTISEAIVAICLHKPDIIFLDIELENGTGFEILENEEIMNLSFSVIFTTAYEQYALQAIKNDAVDYLLKPIDINELLRAISKVKNKKSEPIKDILNSVRLVVNPSSKLKLVNREGFDLVDFNSILYCKSEINYTRFYFLNGTNALTSKTLKSYQQDLEESHFLRIHKSHVVNLLEIVKYHQGNGGQVVLSNGSSLDVSKTYKSKLLETLERL